MDVFWPVAKLERHVTVTHAMRRFDSCIPHHLFEGSTANNGCCNPLQLFALIGAHIGSTVFCTRALHSTGSGQSLLSSECRFESGSAFQMGMWSNGLRAQGYGP